MLKVTGQSRVSFLNEIHVQKYQRGDMAKELLTLNEAAKWATDYIGRQVSPHNINYLVQYAKVRKYQAEQAIKIRKSELKWYYDENIFKRREEWKAKLGSDLNWQLSFDNLKEADTTKHVHRLHPYKGKFIPQLVEYFLDSHVDAFKTRVFFNQGDIILDPFMGSGTTLVQAAELGLHSIGIDISEFNCLISKVKLNDYDIVELNSILNKVLLNMMKFSGETFDDKFDVELKERLSKFNQTHFPNPEFKHQIRQGRINEKVYGEEKARKFLRENEDFFIKNGTKDKEHLLNENEMPNFLSKWFSKRIRQELFFYLNNLEIIKDNKIKDVLKTVLSRTARACRATTHSDLATLKEPQTKPYYCHKHRKICTPINSILVHLRRNTIDTIKRLNKFSKLKKKVKVSVIHGDSRKADIFEEIKKHNANYHKLLVKKKIDGVFTSPPYVGQIDYHEQHAYAYDLFHIPRKDDAEIGPSFKGQGLKAKEEYVEGISQVLRNISNFVKDDGDFFIVANDKYNIYPKIAEKSKLKIVNQFKRPVLNRSERDRQPYSEIIFHMKKSL